ncbi:MAG: DoxX family protein [Chitinophagaceae bacterium]|jgi:putative oxidoreductase|nr:MAG: DoxX family protein [Chitinophagaceae bacterium]
MSLFNKILFSAGAKNYSFGLLILRVAFGLGMAWHGLGKLDRIEGFTEGVAAMGFPMPEFFALAAIFSELIGGLFLALGFLSRPSALFIAFTMFIAAFIRHADDPFSGKEKALAYLVVMIVLFITGPGKYSVDYKISNRK